VFLSGEVVRCNAEPSSTNSALHRAHLATLHHLATAEFLLGLAAGIAQDAAQKPSQGVRERLAQMIAITESVRVHLHDAQSNAAVDRWGVLVPARATLEAAHDPLPGLYRRVVEIAELCDEPPANPDQPVTMHQLARMLAPRVSGGADSASPSSTLDDPVRSPSLADWDLKPLIDRALAFLSRLD